MNLNRGQCYFKRDKLNGMLDQYPGFQPPFGSKFVKKVNELNACTLTLVSTEQAMK
jgi:hypothetical protein